MGEFDLIKSDLKILFLGTFKAPFIRKDYELLKQYYNIDAVNLDITQIDKEGVILYLWWIISKGIFKVSKYDIIYIWFADIHAIPLIILSKLFRKKSIIVIGGGEVAAIPELNYGNQRSKFRGFSSRWCIRNANFIIVPSESYEFITKSVEPRSNVYVVPHSIDKSLYEHPLPEKLDRIVTALCTLKSTKMLKGIHTFESAAKLVPYECVIYKGIPHELLMDKLRESKVYCQLSYTESFGVTNLEAMACGCVPVVTNRNSLPEVVGDSGIVVPYGDVEATAKAMKIAITMDGGKARERSKLFTDEKKISVISKIFEITPLVSVVIPSYDSAKWLPEIIESILNQTYKNIEIIVVDDCSNDSTFEIISKYNNVRYFKNHINMGECVSSRRGFDEANGEYICRLSSDDMYANINKIKNQMEIMRRSNADWSYNSVNCSGETLKNSKITQSAWISFSYINFITHIFDGLILKFPYLCFVLLFFGNPVNSSTFMFKKSSYMKSIRWTTGKRRTDCDGMLLYNLFLDRFKCVVINEMGSFYRVHPGQMSHNPIAIKDVRANRLEMIEKVICGNYPLWLKYTVKIIRRFI